MKILAVKLGALGDVLRVTPAIHSLHDSGHDVDVVTSAVGAQVFRNNPYIGSLYRLHQKKNPFKLFLLTRDLQKNGYECIVNFETRKKIRDTFSRLGCRKYIGGENIRPEKGNVNTYFYDVVRELLAPGVSMYPNELFPTEDDTNYVNKFLEKFGGRRKVGIHVGTSKTNRLLMKNFLDVRLWPVANYIELIETLVQQDCRVFLTGSHSEKTINESIRKATGPAHVVDTSGKFNIQQLQVLISYMDCFISSDTGPAHIAASVPVRQICLCGPTDARHSAPHMKTDLFLIQKNPADCPPCYATDKKRKQGCRVNRCMRNISVKDVLKNIQT